MIKSFLTLLISVFLTAVLISPAVAPTNTLSTISADNFEQIFADIVSDYELFISLTRDVDTMSQYQVSRHAKTPDAATCYLSPGFDPVLSQALVDYYLQYLPNPELLAVIPTESIPTITEVDKPYINLKHISSEQVILERLYEDCYIPGDRYLYRITARYNSNRWVITDLQLDCLTTSSSDVCLDLPQISTNK